MEELPMPKLLVASAEQNGWSDWLDTVPGLVAELAERWSLTVGTPFQPGGETAWVAPVRDREGTDLVLKIGWPHPEARHEAAGLRAWDGDGTVRLVRTDVLETATALLLERCSPGTALSDQPEPEQDEVVAGLLRRLGRAPDRRVGFPTLQSMCDQWADEFEAKPAPDLDPGLVRDGIALFRSLPGSAPRSVLLTTDLHAGNVLAAEREPWLAIDPKPHVGDPTYDALQHLLNCERLHTEPDAVCRRVADLATLDPDRLRLWLFARCVQESPRRPVLAAVARALAPS